MFETSANATVRQAMQQAHTDRGAVLAGAWSWLFGAKTSR